MIDRVHIYTTLKEQVMVANTCAHTFPAGTVTGISVRG